VSARLSRIAAVAVVVAYPIVVLVAFLLARSAGGEVWDEFANGVALGIPFGAFGLVGALIIARRPGNIVGWICVGLAGFAALLYLALAYGGWSSSAPVAPAGTTLAIWVANWAWFPLLGAATIALPLLIPDGRLVSPRWRWVAAVGVVAVGGLVLLAMFHHELWALVGDETIRNPIGIPGVPSPVDSGFANLLVLLLGAAGLGALASIVVRYRRAGLEDRMRLKWIVYGIALTVVLTTILDVVQSRLIAAGGTGISNTIWAIPWMLVPASMGIAVLRHRLFDIDRIVSRTVSYAIVTVVLAGVYATGVLGFGGLLRAVTGGRGGDLVVAASTLAVAAAFGPVRRRAQSAVDRRFNRARYDAQRTIEAFSQRLRDEVDLAALTEDLQRVVALTVHPSAVGLWIVPAPVEDTPKAAL
jgi:hypothetical protein